MTKLSDQDCKEIISRRDKRFDGRFYFGVKTTKIYCRPVCPAKPNQENIIIFRSQSEAENNGYRACLRCRPDRAPTSKFMEGTSNSVSRALKLIQNSPEKNYSVALLSRSLGMTDRHLRRLFDEYLGASPVEIMTTQRVHFAKQLLLETNLPISEVVRASGFQSVRQFNDVFKAKYRQTPSDVRRGNGPRTSDIQQLTLPIRLPYDWNQVMAYLKRHEAYGIERAENSTYMRFIRNKKTFGTVTVAYENGNEFLNIALKNVPTSEFLTVLARLKMLFDTDHNPIYLPKSGSLVPNGIRVPGNFDAFEISVSIILSQLVSTQQAKQKLRQLIETFGTKLGEDDIGPIYEFPKPQALAVAQIETIGIPKTRAYAIRELSNKVANHSIRFDRLGDFSDTTQSLLAIKGIGPWTASMIAMRCLGDPDAFPAADLIIARAIDQRLIIESDWKLSRAYLTHCLWRDYSATLTKTKRKT